MIGFLPAGYQRRIDATVDGCWVWIGKVNPSGYGIIGNERAHRRIYELLVGPIPEGHHLDHLCNVTRCVCPDHLEPVTPAENMRRRVARRTTCKRGHPFVSGQRCRQCRRDLRAERRDERPIRHLDRCDCGAFVAPGGACHRCDPVGWSAGRAGTEPASRAGRPT